MAKSIRRLIRGKSSFVSDLYLPGMLYGHTVRSPAAHATLLAASAGGEDSGSEIVLRAEDVPGSNLISVGSETIPLLADGEVHYLGEPTAIVAAPSQREALAAAAKAFPIVQELPAAFSIDSGDEAQVVSRRRRFSGNPDLELSNAKQVIEGTYRTGIQEHLYSEPHGAVAVPEPDRITIHVASQWPYHVRATVCAALGVKERSVRVLTYDPGISLDGKLWFPSIVAAHAALLAYESGKPVKLVYSSLEDFCYSPKRAPVVARYTTGHDAEGRLLAARIRLWYNSGAHPLFTEEMLAQLVVSSLSPYRCRHYDVEAIAYRSNLPPLNCYSGFGAASASFARETHIGRVAEIAQLPHAKLRKEQLAAVGDPTVTSGRSRAAADPVGVIEAVTAAADFERRSAAYELQKKRRGEFSHERGACRGIGLAFDFQPASSLAATEGFDSATVKVRLEQGGNAVVLCGTVAGSSAVIDYWRDRVAEILELDRSLVQIETRDTSLVPNGGPSVFSKNVTLITDLVEAAATAVKRRRFRSPLPIEVRKGGRRSSSAEWDVQRLEGNPLTRAARGAAIVEVEVDPATLECRAREAWLSVDVGRLIDRQEAIRTIEMGIYQALDWAAGEALHYDGGSIGRRGLLVYRDRTGTQQPALHIDLRETSGARPKGIGDLPYGCVPAAFAAAVSQATGYYIDQLPASAQALHTYMNREEAG